MVEVEEEEDVVELGGMASRVNFFVPLTDSTLSSLTLTIIMTSHT